MAQTKKPLSTLAIPIWFIVIVCWLLSFRVYAKLTQATAPAGKGVAWVSPEQCEALLKKPGGPGKDLVLYEFTADWCPPCKKRERVYFRAPSVISEINNNFIPVRVDLTNKQLSDLPATKALTDKFDVESIPYCVVTLASGQKVDDDRYSFHQKFSDFVVKSKERSHPVKAKLALVRGDYQAAIKELSKELIAGDLAVSRYEFDDYLMVHHLLVLLNRQPEIEPMMQKSFAKTADYYKRYDEDKSKAALDWLKDINSYLRGQISDKQLIAGAKYEQDKANCYLAIGLSKLRSGAKSEAIKALHQAAVLSSKSYRSDGLSEPLVESLEK
jgi:thiol-disulfide isomerase/thioredoxin